MRRALLCCLLPAALVTGCGSQGGLRFPFGGRAEAEPDSNALRLAAIEQRLERIDIAVTRLDGLVRQNHAATQADLGEVRDATHTLTEKVAALERRGSSEPRGYGMQGFTPATPGAGEGLVWLDEPGSTPGAPGAQGPSGFLPGGPPAGGAPGAAAGAGEGVGAGGEGMALGGAPEGTRGDASAEGQRLYQVAYQDLMEENYQLALINFRAFLERYPQTRLSDNAQYWIGEVHYGQHQFQAAIEEFRRVIEEYPNGDKVPAAYYKLALCFQNLRDLPTARRYLEFILRQFPEAREARLAEATLSGLR